MKIQVDEKSLSMWKERFGVMVDEAISLGEKLFAQYEGTYGSDVSVAFSRNTCKGDFPDDAKLQVLYRFPDNRKGAPLAPMIFFEATNS